MRVAKETIKAFDSLPSPRGITPIVLDFGSLSLKGIESQKISTFTAIASRATGAEGHAPMNAAGLTLQNGETLATYDWISTAAVRLPASD